MSSVIAYKNSSAQMLNRLLVLDLELKLETTQQEHKVSIAAILASGDINAE
jgi:hypothetical protein